MHDLTGLGQIVDSKVAQDFYKDTASGALQEVGKIGADLAKTARLFLAPIQIAASFQNRFENYLKTLEKRVPEEFRIEVHPQISGPALESMRYIDETDALWAMFCELLSKAADSRSVQYAHPSFIHILRQLTRDEVYLLTKLRNEPFLQSAILGINLSAGEITSKTVTETTVPFEELHNPKSFDIYYSHLESLSLTTWPVTKQEPIYEQAQQTGINESSKLMLTAFGELFIDACTEKSGSNLQNT